MSERDHGWPEGYNWPEYLAGQMWISGIKRAEAILVEEIAPMEDKEEQERALTAWLGLRCGKTEVMTKTLTELGAPGYVPVNVSRLLPV